MASDEWAAETSRADITLCIFPHLAEFIAVDSRPGLPGRPRFDVVRVEDVFDEPFLAGLEAEFSSLLRRLEKPFLKLLSLSQEVETAVRLRALRAILSRLNADVEEDSGEAAPSVAVLFLTGPFLTLDDDGLRSAVRELLGSQLQSERLDACVDTVATLASREREQGEGASSGDLGLLIRGDSSHYATLWQSGEE